MEGLYESKDSYGIEVVLQGKIAICFNIYDVPLCNEL